MQHPRTALLQLVVLAVLAALAATTTALPTVGEIESLSNVADGGAALDADKQARIGELEVAKQRWGAALRRCRCRAARAQCLLPPPSLGSPQQPTLAAARSRWRTTTTRSGSSWRSRS